MKKIVPHRLKTGDEVRIVAPAIGLQLISKECRDISVKRFNVWGLKFSFVKNTNDENFDMMLSTSIEKRVDDIHQAFLDENVKAIFSVIGGSNSNQLLPYLDFELIKNNPKIFCGFSDITSLINSIYAKTGMVAFYGPHFSSLGMKKGCEYTIDNLKKMIMGEGEAYIEASEEWSDDLWFLNQEDREFVKNDGQWVIKEGVAEGKIIAANLCSFNLLLGTNYRPKFEADTILFIEDCFHSTGDFFDFDRNLQALIYQEDFKNVKGLIIGRFQKESKMSKEKLEFLLDKKELKNMPIIANVDFGHTTPMLTIPVGGSAKIDSKNKIKIQI